MIYIIQVKDIWYMQLTSALQRSRGVPSLCRSLLRSWATFSRTSSVFRNGNTASGSDNCALGHQHVVHCVVGHIVALETSSPSMQRKSRNTRERRYRRSPNRKWISRPDRSLICCTRMSMQEWYRRVLRSDRHSSVCENGSRLWNGRHHSQQAPCKWFACNSPVVVATGNCMQEEMSYTCHIPFWIQSYLWYNTTLWMTYAYHIYGIIQEYEWHMLIKYYS